ncbi:adhesion G protein-coupled receptor E1-like isoform X1 [Leucoraja erinacea]|uniref:adhesion G protein-coupled receptor E1-like isoform X1 n=1 Tax=Leucoraja erinaceus TaxID=7782 RepID=UPI0024584349|nr:adhesion G protein-coupled receptor E1-like isoform X1 [Leucoraja erinacea]
MMTFPIDLHRNRPFDPQYLRQSGDYMKDALILQLGVGCSECPKSVKVPTWKEFLHDNVPIDLLSSLLVHRTLTLKAAARMLVLGSTWILGIFQVDESTMVLSHLFTVINSLQGLFVFLIYCVFNRQVVTECRKWLTRKHKNFTTESSQTEMNPTETHKTS